MELKQSASINHELSTTPTCHMFTHELPRRILWQKNKSEQKFAIYDWKYISSVRVKKERWEDDIESPQYVDFTELDIPNDSFFDTKPDDKPLEQDSKSKQLPTTDIILESFRNISLHNEEKLTEKLTKLDQNVEKCAKEKKTLLQNKIKNNLEKPRHNLNLQNKCKQKQKENVKKVVETQSISTYIFNKLQPTSNCINNINIQKAEHTDDKKVLKKPSELWKKEPFLPRPPKRYLERPKSPRLLTTVRAEKRKHFEEILKEKEKEIKHKKQMDAILKKQQEQKDITQLRKETVHKARPVPNYKFHLPQVSKRPLIEPISPFHCKRRRCT